MSIQSVPPANNSRKLSQKEMPVTTIRASMREQIMTNLAQVKVTHRDQQVLHLLTQGCSNREIGGQLNISLGTVKNHLRILFSRAGILDGHKRVKLARYVQGESAPLVTPCHVLTPKESRISILVWEGLTNREIATIVGTSEQMIKNNLRSAFDKIGVWSRLELAMHMVSHNGNNQLPETKRQHFLNAGRSTRISNVA